MKSKEIALTNHGINPSASRCFAQKSLVNFEKLLKVTLPNMVEWQKNKLKLSLFNAAMLCV